MAGAGGNTGRGENQSPIGDHHYGQRMAARIQGRAFRNFVRLVGPRYAAQIMAVSVRSKNREAA